MTRFRYIARSGGYELRGVIAAESRSAAVAHLQAQGYDRVRVKPVRTTLRQFVNTLFVRR